MYVTNPRKRQTEILDDETAMAIAAPAPKKQKSDGKKTGGFRFSNKPIQSKQGTRTPRVPTVTANVPRYYEANGLRVPLFQKDSRKKREARLATVLHKRLSETKLLDIVEEYAGRDKRNEMSTMGKKELAEWIARVEELALGANKRNVVVSENDSKKMPESRTNVSHTQVNTAAEANRKKLVPASQKAKQMANATANNTPQANRKSHTTTTNISTQVPELGKETLSSPTKSVQKRTFSQVHGIDEERAVQDLAAEITAHFNKDSRSPSTKSMHQPNVEEHRVVKEPTPGHHHLLGRAKVIGLVKTKKRVLITPDPERKAYQPHYSYSSNMSTPQLKPPYLKPGKHGWDWESHKWHFANDPDLNTGYGHQVEPADQERFDQQPEFRDEFFEKYPGRFAHTWPCGCQKPWKDDESEEE
jgi:hypothetical protein